MPEVLVNYQLSVKVFNDVRNLLESKDEWKIGLRSACNPSYTSLWRVLLKQGKTVEALLAAEGGQAQALRDLMRSHYLFQASQSGSRLLEEKDVDMLSSTSLKIVFLAFNKNMIHTSRRRN